MSMTAPELLTADELGERLKATGRTIRRWRRQGIIPGIPITGNTHLYDWNEVIAALKKRGSTPDQK